MTLVGTARAQMKTIGSMRRFQNEANTFNVKRRAQIPKTQPGATRSPTAPLVVDRECPMH